uniref:Uncharacterized protein n=1 Tax=Strigamia maritima TaxID=126957 RepID=T1J595_STRMM
MRWQNNIYFIQIQNLFIFIF